MFRNEKLIERLKLGNTMGMFDTYINLTKEEYDAYYLSMTEEQPDNSPLPRPLVDAQLKVGDPVCDTYCIGSEVDKGIPDGLYLGHDGFVAIFGGKLVGVYNELKNSDGSHVLCEAKDINFGNTTTWGILYGKDLKTSPKD